METNKAQISIDDIYAGILAIQSILLEKNVCTEEELLAAITSSEQIVAQAILDITTSPLPHGPGDTDGSTTGQFDYDRDHKNYD